MSSFNHNEEDKHLLPQLIYSKKKKNEAPQGAATPNSVNKSVSGNGGVESVNYFIQDKIGTPNSLQAKQPHSFKTEIKKPQPEKVVEIKNKAIDEEMKANLEKIDTKLSRADFEKSQQNSKSKQLIAEMLNKIEMKNVSQEIYIASNEIFDKLMEQIDKQIEVLRIEAEKKKESASLTNNNITLKKQLDPILREINHCETIRALYIENMKEKNKTQSLEKNIFKLKSENEDLKNKVCQGIKTIQNYKHDLPCDGEKELKRQLTLCMQELSMEKQMRQNLQKNIESIIINFKRLYDEADESRQIVTKKLREIEEREQKIKNMKSKSHELDDEELNVVVNRENGQKGKAYLEVGNDFSMGNYRKISADEARKSPTPIITKRQTGNSGRQKQMKQSKQSSNLLATMEQKIKKMKNNQVAFNRLNQG